MKSERSFEPEIDSQNMNLAESYPPNSAGRASSMGEYQNYLLSPKIAPSNSSDKHKVPVLALTHHNFSPIKDLSNDYMVMGPNSDRDDAPGSRAVVVNLDGG